MIVSNFATRLRYEITSHRLEQWWIQHQRFTPSQIQLINFKSIGKAMQSLPSRRQLWVAKMIANEWPTGRQMVRRGEWTRPHCPICQNGSEDVDHVVACPHPQAVDTRHAALNRCHQKLIQLGTQPGIAEAFIAALRESMGEAIDPTQIQAWVPHQVKLLHAQRDLGRSSLYRGWLHIQWQKCQQLKWTSDIAEARGSQWAKQTIALIWETVYDLWLFRNQVLADARLHEDPDKDNRLTQMQAEWNRGQQHLHPIDLRLMNTTWEELQARPRDDQIAWLQAMTTARHAGQNRQ